VERDTRSGGRVVLAPVSLASTSLAPAFTAGLAVVTAPRREVVYASWSGAVARSAAHPLLFHRLTVGLSRAADQYNNTLNGALLRGLAASVAEGVGGGSGGGGGGGGDAGGGVTGASTPDPSQPSYRRQRAGGLVEGGVRGAASASGAYTGAGGGVPAALGRSGSPPAARARARARARQHPHPPAPTILVVHRSTTRRITNEAALLAALDAWARPRGGAARAVVWEEIGLAQVVAAVRGPPWVAIVGVDGTGLLNAVWARAGCGMLVRLAPAGTAALLPNKGVNFDRVAALTAGGARVWEDDKGERGGGARGKNLTASSPAADRFLYVTRQDVGVDVGAVVRLVGEGWARRVNYGE